MSYRLDGKDIVISGFEEGVAASPYQGPADVRNVNLVSFPGEASVNFKTRAMTLPPAVAAAAFSVSQANETFTWAGGSTLYNGMAFRLDSLVGGTGLATGVVYYAGNVTATTFKAYTNISAAMAGVAPVNVTLDGTGTFSSYQAAAPAHTCVDYTSTFNVISNGVRCGASYMVDTRNQVWLLLPYDLPTSLSTWPAGSMIYLGNITSSASPSGVNSICVSFGYLFLFRDGAVDLWHISTTQPPASRWTYAWAGLTVSSNVSLRSLAAQDDAIYVCNGGSVASILENPGEVFDPADPTTYTANADALLLPSDEIATCLAELGTNLLVGGVRSFVYPWDRVSTSYAYPLAVPERYVSLIVATNSDAYIFAGNQGRVYVTNGAGIDLFKEVPDCVAGSVGAYFVTGGTETLASGQGTSPSGDAWYWKGELYFTFVSRSNAGALLGTTTGLWAVNLDTRALRMVNQMSYATYAGRIGAIVPNVTNFTPGGEGMFCCWTDGADVPGADVSYSTPYDTYTARIDTELIPVGTYLQPNTSMNVEVKLSAPLQADESFKVSYRANLADAFTQIGETTTAGLLADVYQPNFQKTQWLQLRFESKSKSSSPSYVRLAELRVRDWPSN